MACLFCARNPTVRVYLVPPLVARPPCGGPNLRHDGANAHVCADCDAFVAEGCLEALTRRFVAAYGPVWTEALGSIDAGVMVDLTRRLLVQFLRYRSDAVLHYP